MPNQIFTLVRFVLLVAATIGGINAPAKGSPPRKSTAIILVHGTYDGSGQWWKEVSNKTTFASELKRGFGEGCEIHPFLWKTSVHHHAREAASIQLAKLLKRLSEKHSNLHVIGHSHGGNVVLSAIGRSGVKIRSVFCLATPHIHLKMKSARRIYHVPVYCSPKSVARIENLINIWAPKDPVVTEYANLRKGIDESDAIEQTEQWRTRLNHPSLVDDNGPFREYLADLTKIDTNTNLMISPSLSIATRNIPLACDQEESSAHEVIHCSRIGFLLGRTVRNKLSSTSLDYLASTVIASQTDTGDPVDRDFPEKWNRRFQDEIKFSGWILKRVDVISLPEKEFQSSGKFWDIDHSSPDMFLQFENDGKKLFATQSYTDQSKASWSPSFHFPMNQSITFQLWDKDLTLNDRMQQRTVLSTNRQPIAKIETGALLMKLEWMKGHY